MNDTKAIITQETIGGKKEDCLRVDTAALVHDYEYIGLWFACDRSRDVYITTEIYEGYGEIPAFSPKPSEEITENSFRKSPKKELTRGATAIRIATRREGGQYCRMKAFPFEDEKSYINFKVIKSRETTYDTIKSGIIDGDTARFMKIGIEDGTGAVDYNDEILFLVLVRSLPPADWKFDPSAIAIRKLPMPASAHLFNVKVKYSTWLGQNPPDGK